MLGVFGIRKLQHSKRKFTVIVYNLTMQVDWNIADDWLNWQKAGHIPQILRTHLFEDSKIYRLLKQDDQRGTHLYRQFCNILEGKLQKVSG